MVIVTSTDKQQQYWIKALHDSYSAVRNALRRLDIAMRRNQEMSMGDYKNFNIQHMLTVLSMRYEVMHGLALAKGVTPGCRGGQGTKTWT